MEWMVEGGKIPEPRSPNVLSYLINLVHAGGIDTATSAFSP
jgi:hypothetical protein